MSARQFILPLADGRHLSKAAQVRMCGNSVCPPVAAAIVRANYAERAAIREAA
jgi:DNA (cytosine-5)-methyltransferase 1